MVAVGSSVVGEKNVTGTITKPLCAPVAGLFSEDRVTVFHAIDHDSQLPLVCESPQVSDKLRLCFGVPNGVIEVCVLLCRQSALKTAANGTFASQ